MDRIEPVNFPEEVSHFFNLVRKVFACVSMAPTEITALPATIETRQLIEQTRSKLDSELDRIARQLEWSHLNIAFYGETNAGKSTLIETLGIFLDEAGRRARSTAFWQGKNLAANADGISIGDGRSDFTRETARFTCEIGGVTVNLFDVPGIEGTESLVVDEILSTISKAHLVFYVNGRPTPPQTGADDGRIGTLEKIRDHLRDEAEVWLLFNKRITSPRALEGGRLASAEEDAALIGSDRFMSSVLGAAFRGHMTLSALPAFLASADCLLPGSDLARQREKFLQSMPASVLLKRSGVEDFYWRLSRTIVPNADRKKEHVNMAKLGRCVADGLKTLETASESCSLHETLAEFCKNAVLVKEEIVGLQRRIPGKFNRARKRICDDFFCKIRNGMEKYHADGMWISFDSTVKRNLDQVTKAEESGLGASLSEAVDEIVLSCQAEIETSIRRLGNQSAGLKQAGIFTAMRVWSGDFIKDHDINTDSGISWIGLGSSIIPVFFGPVGWAAMTVGIVSSTWKVLSPRHQEAEQRKAISQILEKMEKNLDEKLKEEFALLIEKLRLWMNPIEESLDKHIKESNQSLRELDEVESGLARIVSRASYG